MTDNEKAATFIGWMPDTFCLAQHISGSNIGICYLCGAQNVVGDTAGKHLRPAPNMRRPENYMRALETLAEHHDFELGPDWRDGKRSGWTLEWKDACVESAYEQPTIGAAVVKTLAALYDAEHPPATA